MAAPRTIETGTSDEFFAVCDRAKAGEIIIYSLEVGKTNGAWILRVGEPPPLPKAPLKQAELFAADFGQPIDSDKFIRKDQTVSEVTSGQETKRP